MFHLLFYFLHCPLSGPVLTYISLLIIPCMIVYVTNKQEPWTLNPWLRVLWIWKYLSFYVSFFTYYIVVKQAYYSDTRPVWFLAVTLFNVLSSSAALSISKFLSETHTHTHTHTLSHSNCFSLCGKRDILGKE